MKLYTTGHPLRFFLVPDDAEWPPGSDTVADVLGEERSVDLAAFAPRYEVPRDVAMAWSRGERQRIEADMVAREAERVANKKLLSALLEKRLAADGFNRERIMRFFSELGLDPHRLLDDDEATATLFAEFVTVAMLAANPKKRDTVLPALKQVLRRHGHPDAAEKLDAGAKLIEREIDDLLAAMRAET